MLGLPKRPFYQETYEQGFEEYTKKQKVIIKITSTHLEFYFQKFFQYKKVEIPFTNITDLGFGSESYRSAGKAAAGAIAGAVLTGGIGLIAGAAIGGKRRQKNTLTLTVNYNNQNCPVFLKPSKNMSKIYTELKRRLPLES